MLEVIILVVVFSAILGGIFWAAARGGFGRAAVVVETEKRGTRRLINVALVFTYVGFGILLPAIMLMGNHDAASAQVGGVKLNAAAREGRILFGEHCAVCHTLAAASAVGKQGPNLDQLKPPYALIMHTLQYGCLQDPGTDTQASCLGYGNMPADVVQGVDARDVAEFVSKVAGH